MGDQTESGTTLRENSSVLHKNTNKKCSVSDIISAMQKNTDKNLSVSSNSPEGKSIAVAKNTSKKRSVSSSLKEETSIAVPNNMCKKHLVSSNSQEEKSITVSNNTDKKHLVSSNSQEEKSISVSNDKKSSVSSYYIDIDCNYICRVCEKTFNSFAKYKVHELLHVAKEDQYNSTMCSVAIYVCMVCEKKFISSAELERHKNRHTAEEISKMKNKKTNRVFKCSICEKRLATADELEKHKKSHLPKYMYPCEYCGFKFKTKQQASIHRDICNMKNQKQKADQNRGVFNNRKRKYDMRSCDFKYSCNDCKCRFPTRPNLEFHMQKYAPKCKTNPKFGKLTQQECPPVLIKYECRNCKFQFKTQAQLKLHSEVCSAKSMSNYGINRKLNYSFIGKNGVTVKKENSSNKSMDTDDSTSDDSRSDDDSRSGDSASGDSRFDDGASYNAKSYNNQSNDKLYRSVIKQEITENSTEEMSTDDITVHGDIQKDNETRVFTEGDGNIRSVSFERESNSDKCVEGNLISNTVAVNTSGNEMYMCLQTLPGNYKNCDENGTSSDITQVKIKEEPEDEYFEMECGICGQYFTSYRTLKSHFDQHEVDDMEQVM